MRIGVCCEPFVEAWGLEAAVERAAAAGYDGIELTAWDVSDAGLDAPGGEIRDAVRIAEAHGVEIVGVYRYVSGGEASVTHPDPDVRSRAVDYLRRVVEFCGRLGGSVVVFGAPEARGTEGIDPEAARANARETFASEPLTSALEAAGVTLCVEPLTWKTDVITTAGEAAALVREVGHPNVRMMVDGYHLLAETGSPGEIPGVIRRCGPSIGHVHADDAALRGPGGGDLDWGPILGALREVGYDGYVSVELHDVYVEGEPAGDRAAALERSAEYLRAVSGESPGS